MWKCAGDARMPAKFSVVAYARLPLAALLAGLVLLVTLLWVRLCDLRLGVRGFCNGANCMAKKEEGRACRGGGWKGGRR